MNGRSPAPLGTSPDRTPTGVTTGTLVEWNDAKGYGFAETPGCRWFVHIREFLPGQLRPVKGDTLSFTRGRDERGRARAGHIRLLRQTAPIGIGSWVFLAFLLVLPFAAGRELSGQWWPVLSVLGTVSLVTWTLYAADKKRAKQGGWRVPEYQLHLAALAGGWPGAFLARRRYRHKTAKVSFRIAFWLIVAVHQAFAADVLLEHAPGRWLCRRGSDMGENGRGASPAPE